LKQLGYEKWFRLETNELLSAVVQLYRALYLKQFGKNNRDCFKKILSTSEKEKRNSGVHCYQLLNWWTQKIENLHSSHRKRRHFSAVKLEILFLRTIITTQEKKDNVWPRISWQLRAATICYQILYKRNDEWKVAWVKQTKPFH